MSDQSNDYVEVFKDADGEWRWRRKDGGNHEITAVAGQGYVNKSHAVSMAFSINQIEPIVIAEDDDD